MTANMNLPISPTAVSSMSPTSPATLGLGQSPAQGPQGWLLLRLGFRPFYLVAAAYAAIAVPLWVAVALGWLDWAGRVPPLLWHAHEMLFGFAAAVIVGFLLTAGKAWTGQATPRGPALGALVLLWLAARLSAVVAPPAVFAALDLALLPLVAFVLARVLLRAGNRRSLPLVGLLVLLTLANAAFHVSASGWWDIDPLRPLHAGLALIVMIECVMAGRVVPAFTLGATPGLKLLAPKWLSPAALAAATVGLAGWVLLPAGGEFAMFHLFTAAALAVAAALHLGLLYSWQPWQRRHRPILWILHAAYAWIPVGFLLLGASLLGWVPASTSAGIHALAVGATGGLIIGMCTRTARGHTGRALKVGRAEVAAYILVMAAAALRVGLPLMPVAPLAPLAGAPRLALAWAWALAGLAWSAAFTVYLLRYAPWLTQTRVDGKDG